MKQSTIYNIFQDLHNNLPTDGRYVVDSFNAKVNHKLGCSKEGYPVFFIECEDEQKMADIKLTLFSVMHNRVCDVYDKTTGENVITRYSVVQLNSDDVVFQKYFLEVIQLLLLKLPKTPCVADLDENIKTIITLFTNAKQPSKESIRGLFAELILIDLSRDPHYLLKSWHVTPRDTYDFNDGIDKIEVKSYTGEIRKHTFSLDQLYTTENSQLVIASIQVIQTGLGMNVYELMDRISLKIQDDITLLIHLRNIIMATVGKYFNEVAEYRFDYEISSESYALFDSLDIPKIDKTLVLPEISNVHFTVDFSGLFPIDSQSKSSTLINAL